MKKGIAIFAVLGGLGGAAVLAGQPMGASAATSKAPQSGSKTDACPTTAKEKTVMILRELHAVNDAEIESGRTAEQKATSSEVKNFASKMVTDHTTLDQSLTTLAHKQGIDLAMITPDDPVHAALARTKKMRDQELSGAEGKTFDVQYLAPEAYEHEVALSVIEEGQKYATGDVKQELDHAHDVVGSHLKTARTLLQGFSLPSPGVGGGPKTAPSR